MTRYAIWDKTSPVITPIGEVLTAEQWVNGGFFGTLGQMKQMYENMGADFSACTTNEEVLTAIEAFEDAVNNAESAPDANERIAAALEYQNMLSL